MDLYALIIEICWWLFHAFAPGSWADGALAAFEAVLRFEAFAGALWQDAQGYAQPWARLVDDLLDLALRLIGLDPQVVRGDH
jgi:hypothetical protein